MTFISLRKTHRSCQRVRHKHPHAWTSSFISHLACISHPVFPCDRWSWARISPLWLTQVYPSFSIVNQSHSVESLSSAHKRAIFTLQKKKKKKVLLLLPHIPISSSDIAPCLPTSLYDTIPQKSYLYSLSSLPLFIFSLEATLSQLSSQPLYKHRLLGLPRTSTF